MIIAATYDNGNIFQHFGHTEQFKIYEINDNKVVSSKVVDTNGVGHGALAGFLNDYKVEALVCGGIGGGAVMALTNVGIKVYGGVSGNADEAVVSLLAGSLNYSAEPNCNHHDHGESHSCSSHGCH